MTRRRCPHCYRGKLVQTSDDRLVCANPQCTGDGQLPLVAAATTPTVGDMPARPQHQPDSLGGNSAVTLSLPRERRFSGTPPELVE